MKIRRFNSRQRHVGLSFFILCLISTAYAQTTANDIIIAAEKQKIANLETYLTKSPEAKDRDVAMEALLDGYELTAQPVKALGILQSRYNETDKLNTPAQELVYGIIQPMYVLLGETQNEKGAQTFFQYLKRDFEKHPDEQLREYISLLPEQFSSEMRRPKVGQPLVIQGKDITGKPIDTSTMKGKVILVDFWATWCRPCVEDLPHVKDAYEKYKDDGFEVIGISLDREAPKLKAFLDKNKLGWPQLTDLKGWDSAWAERYGITGIPATFLIGKDGNVAVSDLGGTDIAPLVAAELAR